MQGTSPGPDAGKTEWRRWFRARRERVRSPDEQSKAIRSQLAELLADGPSKQIAIFAALPGEPEILSLLETHPRHQWLLPRVDGNRLSFHRVGTTSSLRPGSFGIAEPTADRPAVSIANLDLIFCPGLGFDRQGIRLGRGKGFYDRALEESKPSTRFLGIAFHEQIVDQLPSEAHDIPMHALVSPDGITEC